MEDLYPIAVSFRFFVPICGFSLSVLATTPFSILLPNKNTPTRVRALQSLIFEQRSLYVANNARCHIIGKKTLGFGLAKLEFRVCPNSLFSLSLFFSLLFSFWSGKEFLWIFLSKIFFPPLRFEFPVLPKVLFVSIGNTPNIEELFKITSSVLFISY